MNYGYVRVSTQRQNTDRQEITLKNQMIPGLIIYKDKMSGKNFKRPEFQKMYKRLKKGDVLYLASVDRLGRNYKETGEYWERIVNKKGCDIVVLDFAALDTRINHDLTSRFLSDLFVKILLYIAEREREESHARIMEGILAAKRRGVRFGRQVKVSDKKLLPYYKKWKAGEITQKQAAHELKLTQAAISYRFIKLGEKERLKNKTK